MRLLKLAITVIFALSASCIISCGDEPLLTNLETNQLMVVIKGTYESNSPMDWAMPPACKTVGTRPDGTTACAEYTAEHLTQVQDDSVVMCDGRSTGTPPPPFGKDDTNPGVFLLDIAEMKLMDYSKKIHKFSNYRQTFSFALNDADPLFNGAGYLMENDDVPTKAYVAIALYVRKMLLDGARSYTPDSAGWRSSAVWDVFAENALPCYNFNKYQIRSYYDSLRLESVYLNRVYPLIIPIGDLNGMIFNNKFPVTILEIRIIVKNFIKKYEMAISGNGTNDILHFYALSDWLQDVQVDDTDIGGNIITVARSYIPGLTGNITGTGGGNDAHVIAIPHDPTRQNIKQYTIPVDPYTVPDPTAIPPVVPKTTGNLRQNNPANLPKQPPIALGMGIEAMLEHYLKFEKYKYDWNQKVPAPCSSLIFYMNTWDTFSRVVSGFKIPELAVFVPAGGQYTIENVSPGTYDVYISNRPPRYGELYHDGEFNFVGTADVSPGSQSNPH
jgi:hypothetical protein